MHNCKQTKDLLIDFALGELSPSRSAELPSELSDCATCQAEYAALKDTLRVSQQALRSALPAEEFWPGYHARLQDKLIQQLQQNNSAASSNVPRVRLPFSSRLWVGVRKVATTSVRVPLPAALAMALLVGVLFLWQRSRVQANAAQNVLRSITSPNPLAPIETRTIEVPVIQERVVTQIVYVEKKGRRHKGASGSLDRADRNTLVARRASGTSGKTAMSLVGFKPTDEVKLTIIKGSYQDEK